MFILRPLACQASPSPGGSPLRRSLVIATLALSGCTVVEASAPLPARTVALYGESSSTMLTPYPSDRYTVPDGTSKTGHRVHLGADTTADPMIAAAGVAAEELNAM